MKEKFTLKQPSVFETKGSINRFLHLIHCSQKADYVDMNTMLFQIL